MAICVLGRELLDQLSSLVVKLFWETENKNVPISEFPERPFQEEHLRQLYKVVPVKDITNLCHISYIGNIFRPECVEVLEQAAQRNLNCAISTNKKRDSNFLTYLNFNSVEYWTH